LNSHNITIWNLFSDRFRKNGLETNSVVNMNRQANGMESPGSASGRGAGQKSSAGPPTIRGAAAFSPSQYRAVLSAANAALWQRTMRSLHLDTKQVELVRLVFSIGVTVFVGVGTFLALRHLIG
jgi:hypothetical protein